MNHRIPPLLRNSAAIRLVTVAALAAVFLVATAALTLGRASSPAPLAPPVPPPPAVAESADVHTFVGLVYPQTSPGDEYPAGVVHLGEGLLVAEHWQPGQAADYGWAQVRLGSRQMLWMQRFLDPPGTQGRRVQVVDAVETGPVDGGYQLVVEGCREGDAPDPEIAAVVRFVGDEKETQAEQEGLRRELTGDKGTDDADAAPGEDDAAGEDDAFEFSSDVLAAWRLDRASGRIVALPAAGLVCQSTGD